MDKPRVTPKDFVLWLGAMATLYGGVIAFIALIFDYINHAFPNAVTGEYYADVYSSSISYETASLIVLTPLFLVLMRLIRRDIARDPTRAEIWVRRWALFLTLFIAGATMAIDLIVLLTYYLQGQDLTIGFLLKVLTVLLVIGLGFMHFMADLWGYWAQERTKARMVNWAVAILVIFAIVGGFFIVGSPQYQRQLKQDATRVQDLQNIQWQVVNYWQQKESLPATLADLKDPISNSIVPVDPATGAAYEYKRLSPLDFELCATFATIGDSGAVRSVPVSPAGDGVQEDSWAHPAGRQCFERAIDPERYPPYSKQTK